MTPGFGLLLLTGGQGRRLGGPKHDRPHPGGGSWGAHLVAVFEAALGPGPTLILGHPLPDRPNLPSLPDAGLGPAQALIQWARRPDMLPQPHRWWVVACDQVRWTPAALQDWAREADQADPNAARWVLGQREGRHQPLGGFLPDRLRTSIQTSEVTRLSDLVASLPHLALAWQGPGWSDLDTPEDLRDWENLSRQSDEVI